MDSVVFIDFVEDKKVKGWNFKKVFPSVLNKKESKEEIWITDERLRIPVGAKKVCIKFFLWVCPGLEDEITCRVGMVPDVTSLDDKAIEILKESTKNQFMKNPYYHLLHEIEYRSIFLEEKDVSYIILEEVRESMRNSVGILEKNLLYFLEGGSSKGSKVESGWSVLVRARSGSI